MYESSWVPDQPPKLGKIGSLGIRKEGQGKGFEMTEGLNLTLSAATLLSAIGIAAKLYMAGKPQKIEQPVVVEKREHPTPSGQCDERHQTIEEQTKNLFSRMNHAEQRIAALEATSIATKEKLTSMDQKLDRLLERSSTTRK
jgi:uncharacterized protein HemX